MPPRHPSQETTRRYTTLKPGKIPGKGKKTNSIILTQKQWFLEGHVDDEIVLEYMKEDLHNWGYLGAKLMINT